MAHIALESEVLIDNQSGMDLMCPTDNTHDGPLEEDLPTPRASTRSRNKFALNTIVHIFTSFF